LKLKNWMMSGDKTLSIAISAAAHLVAFGFPGSCRWLYNATQKNQHDNITTKIPPDSLLKAGHATHGD
jgi:hypothetical protein